MHISHCSTLKITPITDLCLQQSDKKKCFDAFAVRTRAHFSSKTKQNNERRREEEQRRSMLYFSPAAFLLLFFRRETGGGEEGENGVVCWGWERRCIFTAATINKQGRKKQDTGAHVHRSHLWLAERSVRAQAMLQKTSFLYFLPSCSYCSTPLFVIPPAVLILLFALFILLSSPSFSPHLLTSCPLSLTSLVCFISLASFSSPIS